MRVETLHGVCGSSGTGGSSHDRCGNDGEGRGTLSGDGTKVLDAALKLDDAERGINIFRKKKFHNLKRNMNMKVLIA